MSPPIVQIAIQGGGARLVALVAAMEALQRLESGNKLKVTRVAGTSAGAIAGALFCARVPMSAARQKLIDLAPRLLESFRMPGRLVGAWRIARGKALWSNDVLLTGMRELLLQHGMLASGGGLTENVALGELAIPMITIATNLNDLTPDVRRDDHGVLSSVTASAALPFLFRSLRTSPASPVDGGICDNLPASELLNEQGRYGPVVGLAFPPDRPASGPQTVAEYAMAIMNAAINHSTNRTRQALGNRCIQLPTQISTFDFSYALGEGIGAEYAKIRDFVETTLPQRLATSFGQDDRRAARTFTEENWTPATAQDPGSRRYIAALGAVGKMYQRQHHDQKVRYVMGRMVVTANSLLEPAGQSDQITFVSQIGAIESPVYCHRIALGQSKLPETILEDSEVSVTDRNGKVIDTINVPMNYADESLIREVLLCFDPLLTPQTGPYLLRCKSAFQDFLRPLRDENEDELGLVLTRAAGQVPRAEIILRYPRRFGIVEAVAGTPAFLPMTEAELGPFRDGSPPEFTTIGWAAEHVVDQFSIRIRRRLA